MTDRMFPIISHAGIDPLNLFARRDRNDFGFSMRTITDQIRVKVPHDITVIHHPHRPVDLSILLQMSPPIEISSCILTQAINTGKLHMTACLGKDFHDHASSRLLFTTSLQILQI